MTLKLILIAALASCSSVAASGIPYRIELSPTGSKSVFVTVSIPQGATARRLSHNGRVDPALALMKWGPLDPTRVHAISFLLEGGSGNLTVTSSPVENAAVTTIPVREDTDNDGVPDDFEQQHQLHIGNDDSAEDPDGDGFTNRDEAFLGTDPNRADDVLKVSSSEYSIADEAFIFHLPAKFASIPLIVETSPTLDNALWRSVDAEMEIIGDEAIFEVKGGLANTRQFFRVRPDLTEEE
ncbi:hypothetical protein JIN85_09615 [Luteolibacter pohnpeiensis]|uniref:Uncharacterized protein n=1 Tax=Luteolibacter pohnpeiensis TaxID=454153 RepID=A0A934S7J9_9BACT|nr:thrombospondin type 3 repeat-containing protein [Luteolibacter pohnpeiensis]MBK1882674.1 hypothetical protein [Luteolibacter pohnpeiensis]